MPKEPAQHKLEVFQLLNVYGLIQLFLIWDANFIIDILF
jgi:hypothetical protein